MKLTQTILAAAIGITLIACGGSSNNVKTPTPTPTPPSEIQAQKVFKEFWDIFDRYYPLMHRKNINWQQVYDENFVKITNATSTDELAKLIGGIVSDTLKDGHTSANYQQQEFSYQPESTPEQTRLTNMLANTNALINFTASSLNNPYISYGTLKSDSNIGYIQSKVFEPVQENDVEFNNFKQIVDQALKALQNTQGIIVDIRTNGGGQGHFAYYLAGRFATNTPQEVVRMRYKTTTGSTESSLSDWVTTEFQGFSDSRAEGGFVSGTGAELNQFNASGDFQYANKVALLTAQGSASAAEYFTVVMKSQPHIRSFGDKTFGIFAGSEMITPNSDKLWKFRVSVQDVEVKYRGSFQSFEGIGLTPDETLYPTLQQVSAGEDIHIQAAINYIKGNVTPPSPVTITKGPDFTDVRDNQVYPTVKIGNQVWMTKNLNFNLAGKSWHYNDDVANGEKHGRLYQWASVKEAIPAGWHLATDAEWKTLEKNLGMVDADLDKSGYEVTRGTDQGTQLQPAGKSMMNIQASGFRSEGQYEALENRSYFWVDTTTTGAEGQEVYRRRIAKGDPSIYRFTNPAADFAISVRLIKD